MTSSKMQSKVTFATDLDRDRAAFAIATGNLAAIAGIKVIVEMVAEPLEQKFCPFDAGQRFALRCVESYDELSEGERWATRDSTGYSVYEKHGFSWDEVARGVNRAEAERLLLEGKHTTRT